MAKVIELGIGKVICNYGTYGGKPAVFLEPVIGEAGQAGEIVQEGREPQIRLDAVVDDGIILVFGGAKGARVLVEAIEAAMFVKGGGRDGNVNCG